MFSLVIVERNGNIIKFNDQSKTHLYGLKKYIEEKNILINDNINETSFNLSIELTKLGIMNFHYENNHVLIFLPYTLTTNQYEYIKDQFRRIAKFDIEISSLNEENKAELYDELEEYRNMMTLFMKIVRKKLKLSKRIEGNNNGFNRKK